MRFSDKLRILFASQNIGCFAKHKISPPSSGLFCAKNTVFKYSFIGIMGTHNCFRCRRFGGRDGDAWYCLQQGASMTTVADPEQGCSDYDHNPKSSGKYRTKEDWIRDNGLQVGRYSSNPKSWPEPLTPAQIRAAWERDRNPDVQKLAWEIARLRDVLDRAAAALREVSSMPMPTYPRSCLERLAELIEIDRGPGK